MSNKQIGLTDDEFFAISLSKAEVFIELNPELNIIPYNWKNDIEEYKKELNPEISCYNVKIIIDLINPNDTLINKLSKVSEIINANFSDIYDKNFKSINNSIDKDNNDNSILVSTVIISSNDIEKIVNMSHHIAEIITMAGFIIKSENIVESIYS
jgi:hypothetical protein